MPIVDKAQVIHAAEEAIRLIGIARKRARMYPLHHPAVKQVVADLARSVGKLTAARPDVSINIAQKEIFLDEIPLPAATLTETDFVNLCLASGVTSLTFRDGVTVEELTKLIYLFNKHAPGKEAESQEQFARAVAQERIDHIAVGTLVLASGRGSLGLFTTPEEQAARSEYDAALDGVWHAFHGLQAGRAIDIDNMALLVNGMVRGLLADRNTYRRLAAIKDYDNYTFNHAVNVAILSLLVGSEIGLSGEQLTSLGMAALLHDVGKLRVPAQITSKAGKLSDEEWDIIRAHPVDGARILLEQCGHRDIAVTVAFEHHTCYDLSGYPTIESDRKQHLFSRIVGLSDVYDAVTSDRSYRRRMMPDAAAAIILGGSGRDFDPALTKLFIRAIEVYPLDWPVILSNEEPAIVCEVRPDDPLRPKVRLIRDSDKIIDLRDSDLRISRCIDAAAAGVIRA